MVTLQKPGAQEPYHLSKARPKPGPEELPKAITGSRSRCFRNRGPGGGAGGRPGGPEEARGSTEEAEAPSKLPKGSSGVLPGCPRRRNVRFSSGNTVFLLKYIGFPNEIQQFC